MPKNSLVASVLDELADYAELEDEEPYRARAYRRAAQAIKSLDEDIELVAANKSLKEIPGIGEAIERKIEEILSTGKLQSLEKLKEKNPIDVSALTKVEGVGPKTVKMLYKELKVRNLEDLESAIKDGRLADFRGLGVKEPALLLERIQYARLQSNRILLVEAENIAARVRAELEKIPSITRFEITGSYRRRRETIGDLDVLVETDHPEQVVDNFTKMDEVKQIVLAGSLKASVKLAKNFQVDLRVVEKRSWGAAMLYFTGSKSHNIELRTKAIRKMYRLNEYGLYTAGDESDKENETLVAGGSEEEIYEALGMEYIEPEMRENRGEIPLAESRKLPKIIKQKDIRGDLQMHTKYSDGVGTVKEMAEAARKNMGYEYVAITDHIGGLKIANAMDEDRIKVQSKEIERLNNEYEKRGDNFHILHGAEVNIKADGSLDMPDTVLKGFEVVLASIHSGFKDDIPKIMMRFSTAFENENVDIIAHPSGRLILERPGYRFDLDQMIEKSLATDTVLEIDGYPNRLDLSDENAFAAIRAGCTLSVDTDSHTSSELEYMRYGVDQARRAWAEPKNILNTRNYKDLSRFLET